MFSGDRQATVHQAVAGDSGTGRPGADATAAATDTPVSCAAETRATTIDHGGNDEQEDSEALEPSTMTEARNPWADDLRHRRVGTFRSPTIDLARQVLLLAGAASLYFGVRALTVGSTALAVAHADAILALEQRLHIGIEGTLQGLVIGHHPLVTAANWVYIFGHWPVIVATFLWLYTRHRDDYRRLRNAMFVSGAIGLVIFWAYPVAPPRLTPGSGLIDTVTEYSHTYRVLQPPAIEDRYASLPSLHVGWNLLVGFTLAMTVRRRGAVVVAALSPLAMAAAVVLTANHFVVDVVLGATIALFGLAVSMRITPRPSGSTDHDGHVEAELASGIGFEGAGSGANAVSAFT